VSQQSLAGMSRFREFGLPRAEPSVINADRRNGLCGLCKCSSVYNLRHAATLPTSRTGKIILLCNCLARRATDFDRLQPEHYAGSAPRCVRRSHCARWPLFTSMPDGTQNTHGRLCGYICGRTSNATLGHAVACGQRCAPGQGPPVEARDMAMQPTFRSAAPLD